VGLDFAVYRHAYKAAPSQIQQRQSWKDGLEGFWKMTDREFLESQAALTLTLAFVRLPRKSEKPAPRLLHKTDVALNLGMDITSPLIQLPIKLSCNDRYSQKCYARPVRLSMGFISVNRQHFTSDVLLWNYSLPFHVADHLQRPAAVVVVAAAVAVEHTSRTGTFAHP
jgi:hypothetical protein